MNIIVPSLVIVVSHARAWANVHSICGNLSQALLALPYQKGGNGAEQTPRPRGYGEG